MDNRLYKIQVVDPNGNFELYQLVDGKWKFLCAEEEAHATVVSENLKHVGWECKDAEHKGDGRLGISYLVKEV